jgi:excisionase family DNA binding protein
MQANTNPLKNGLNFGGHMSGTQPLLYTVETLCLALGGTSRSKAYTIINEGRIKAYKEGGRTVFKPADVQRYVDNLPSADIHFASKAV